MVVDAQSARLHLSSNGRASIAWFDLVRDFALLFYLVTLFARQGIQLVIGVGKISDVGAASAGDIFSQVVITAFLLIGILWNVAHRTPLTRVVLVAWPLVPVIIWILLSATWSGLPDVTIRRGIRLAMEVSAIILFAAAYRDPVRLMRVMFVGFAMVLLLDLAFLAAPSISFSPIGYNGVHPGKNLTGAFCLVAFPLFVLAYFNRRIFPIRLVCLVLALATLPILVISQSKTALALAILCPILTLGFVTLGRARPVTASSMFLILILGAFICLGLLTNSNVGDLLSAVIGDATFTGRDRIWDYTLYLFWQSPIFGQGYGSLWYIGENLNTDLVYFGHTSLAGEAHNGYLDVMAQLGLVGLVLMLMFIAVTIYRLWVAVPFMRGRPIALFAIYFALGIVIYDITESNLLRSGGQIWQLFLLVAYTAHMTTPKWHRPWLPR